LPLGVVYLCFRAGEIGNGLFVENSLIFAPFRPL